MLWLGTGVQQLFENRAWTAWYHNRLDLFWSSKSRHLSTNKYFTFRATM